ncbi:MAG TPA: hypothetical protein VIK91_17765 [Nannocystis sp.]
MRLTSTSAIVFLSSLTLAACSTAQEAESASASATATATAGSSGASSAGTTTGDHGLTTSGEGASESSGGTTTGWATTTMSVDSDTEATGTLTTGSTGTTGLPDTTGTTSDGTSSGTTTTGGLGGPCEVDADCKLHDDCCSCYAIPVDQDDEQCGLDCDQSMCASMGIDQAVCRFGVCTLEKVDCSSPVLCDALPPVCEPGKLPSREGGCWTGYCVPAEACDKVPDCSLCPDAFMCVEYEAWELAHACEPVPADCQGTPTCECAGPHACTDGFDVCNEGKGDNDLICVCPAC